MHVSHSDILRSNILVDQRQRAYWSADLYPIGNPFAYDARHSASVNQEVQVIELTNSALHNDSEVPYQLERDFARLLGAVC